MVTDHADMDYREHERTYAGFVRLLRFVTLAIVVVLILMAVVLI